MLIKNIFSADAEECINKQDKDQLMLAFRSFLSGDIESSFAYIFPLIGKYPEFKLIEQLIKENKFEEALKLLDRVFIDNFDFEYPYKIVKAMVFSGLGVYQEALTLIDEAIEQSDPYFSAIAYYQKGIILSAMGKNDDAKECFEKGIYNEENIASLETMENSHTKIISALERCSTNSLKQTKSLVLNLPHKGDVENYVIVRVWLNPDSVGHTSLQTSRHYISLWPADSVEKSQLHTGMPPLFLNHYEDVRNEGKHLYYVRYKLSNNLRKIQLCYYCVTN